MTAQNKPNNRGPTRLFKAAGCSWKGFKYIWKSEEAFRQEVVLCIFLLPTGVILGNTGVEQALLIGSVLQVLLVELLNTAIECAIDRIGPEFHALSGHAKDLGSSAVMLSVVIAIIIWGLVLRPWSWF